MRLQFVAALGAMIMLGASSALYAQGAMRSIWDGTFTSAQADKGKALYVDKCAKCHGGTLDGNDEIPALKGSNFMADWETQSVGELINRVRTTMPIDDPGTLSTESTISIVSYMLQQNGLPTGSAELNVGTASQIRIDAEKPSDR